MKYPKPWLVVAVLALGVGATPAYDAYREHRRQKDLAMQPPDATCSLCSAPKADLELMRIENARKPLTDE